MTGPSPATHFAVQALLNAAGILAAFLLSATATALFAVAGTSMVQPLMALLLAATGAALAHASRQAKTAAAVLVLSVLPFAIWLAVPAGDSVRADAWVTAAALLLAPLMGAWTGHYFIDSQRWRAAHSATALLTATAVLLIILAPLLLMMPR